MAITGNPGDLATGGFGTGISGRAATPGNVASAVSRGNAMAAGRMGGGPGPTGGLLGNAMRAGGFAGAASAGMPGASLANQLAVSRGAGLLGQLGGTPLALNDAQIAMEKARILEAALRAQYGNAGLLKGGVDALARTIAGEAAGETDLGQTAVAQTMLNRMALASANPEYSYLDRLPQYSAFTDKNKPFQAAAPGTPEYNRALTSIANAMNPNNALPDAVRNATHYYASEGANAINAPSWARGQNFTQLGAHTFGLASELSPQTVAAALGRTPAQPSITQGANNVVASVAPMRVVPTAPVMPTVSQMRVVPTAPAVPTVGPIDITPRPAALPPATMPAEPVQTAMAPVMPSRPYTPTPTRLEQIASQIFGNTLYDDGTKLLPPDRTDAARMELAMSLLEAGARKPATKPTTTQPEVQQTLPPWWTNWYNQYGSTGGILG